MFDGVPISAAFVSKSEDEPLQCVLEMMSVIDKQHHVPELVFLAEFAEKQYSESRFACLKQPNVAELISLGSTAANS